MVGGRWQVVGVVEVVGEAGEAEVTHLIHHSHPLPRREGVESKTRERGMSICHGRLSW